MRRRAEQEKIRRSHGPLATGAEPERGRRVVAWCQAASRARRPRTGLSSKAYWHLARTLATQTGMTNDWLKSQGLLSVRDLWMKAHGYA
jgi:hypothetical protein